MPLDLSSAQLVRGECDSEVHPGRARERRGVQEEPLRAVADEVALWVAGPVLGERRVMSRCVDVEVECERERHPGFLHQDRVHRPHHLGVDDPVVRRNKFRRGEAARRHAARVEQALQSTNLGTAHFLVLECEHIGERDPASVDRVLKNRAELAGERAAAGVEPIDGAAGSEPNKRAGGPLGARGELDLVGRDGGRSGPDLGDARRDVAQIAGDVLDVVALGRRPISEHLRRGTGPLKQRVDPLQRRTTLIAVGRAL